MKNLWYKDEAKKWEESFPLGNGRIGGMFFCGRGFDRIGISEDTIWSGTPHKGCEKYDEHKYDEAKKLLDNREYDKVHPVLAELMCGKCPETFLTAGNIYIDMQGWRQGETDRSVLAEIGEDKGELSYKRSLDMETAVMDCNYIFDGIGVKKQAFISYPDNVMVYKIKLDHKSDFMISVSCPLKHTVSTKRDEILINGECPFVACKDFGDTVKYSDDISTIRFAERIKVVTDGTMYDSGAALYIKTATEVYVYMTIATSFDAFDKLPEKEYLKASEKTLADAMAKGYDELLKRHIEDYSGLFSKSDITIGKDNGKPTDERIKNPEGDENLAELLFAFGKYLLISSSREGTNPANLQGIWNDTAIPPFHSSYTTNINLQMNYWPAEICNLSECHMPMLSYVKDCAKLGHSLSDKGWNTWHCTDIWRYPYETLKLVGCAFWPMSGVWMCEHIWEHYQYTKDIEFLKEYIGVLKGACDFLTEWMTRDENGKYITTLSSSPENRFIYNGEGCAIAKASTIDQTLAKELFGYTIEAMELLGEDATAYKEFAKDIKELQIGEDGRLLEWNEDFTENDKGHRHLSHLYGIYPSNVIKEGTDLWDAAKESIRIRVENGSGYTGWSNAWMVNLFARLKDRDSAHNRVLEYFKSSSYPNMFDRHPPFQIDGNFGMCAGIAEMLMQSHTDYCELIPCLPKEWEEGSVRGLKARGGYTVSFAWKNGEITESHIVDINGNEVKLEGNRFAIRR